MQRVFSELDKVSRKMPSLSNEKVDGSFIWKTIGKALGAEPREHYVIRGASGLDHAIEGISVDEKGSRVFIFSAEPNPRTAALVQVDIQTTMPDTRVLLARPIAFDIGRMARQIVQDLGNAELNLTAMSEKIASLAKEREEGNFDTPAFLNNLLEPIAVTFNRLTLPPVHQWMSAVQQMALIDWEKILESMNEKNIIVPLQNLLTLDVMSFDREAGICPVPLYEFTEADWEILLSGKSKDDVLECLRRLGILQYFYPPPDHVALAVADRSVSGREEITSILQIAPNLGHPFGSLEILDGSVPITEIIQGLQDKGLVVDGEMGMEVTATGSSARATVRFKPREGVVSKLLSRLNVSVGMSPKDLL